MVDEVRWLGADVKAALQRPKTGYIRPHIGRTLPPETKLSTYKSDKQKAMDILLRPERVKVGGWGCRVCGWRGLVR